MNSKQQIIIGNTIKILTYVAITISCLGFIIYSAKVESIQTDYQEFNRSAVFNWNDFKNGIFNLDGYNLTLLGIIILMITPILRVLLITIAFALNNNKRYTIIGILILSILAISSLIGMK